MKHFNGAEARSHELIPYNKPYVPEGSRRHVSDLMQSGALGVDGPYIKACESWLSNHFAGREVMLTQSCSDALEIAAMLSGAGPGDEVILPSYTFSSTANAFALRGASLVFVDVLPGTLNIDPDAVRAAITERTRAIAPVHYAGVSSDMDAIMRIAREHSLFVVEDAAQSLMSTYKGEPAGISGDVSAISFHNTKNISSGEGGALVINNSDFAGRAAVLAEKGTNRKAFYEGQTDKYTWVDIGTSAVTSQLTAAFLLGQLEEADSITKRRVAVWDAYHEGFAELEAEGLASRPHIPSDCTHNGHIYHLLLERPGVRGAVIAGLRERGVSAPFHYLPLHAAPAGRANGRAAGDLPVTGKAGSGLIRLPLWPGLEPEAGTVIEIVRDVVRAN